ncbi:hypothetical protein [Reichenbachiella sp. MALMAid0571]|uniref:hypothetical protein n=1 Tax=Reichenbachiella sp. MALMAid0571 TaxID=3143939 RepID=UPI0032DF8044
MNDTLTINKHDTREGYQSDFDRIAKVLLNHFELTTKENSYRIREIEFYYYSVIHKDFYCHKNERQLTNQKLYFHRFKDPEKYVRLKQKGIDITFGNEETVYGGILIRSIENIKTSEIITGIGNLTNQIISDIDGTFSIVELYKSDKNIFDSSGFVYLKTCQNNELKIFKKHRQGLNLKKEDSDKFYLDLKYNYFTYPEIEVLT